MRDSLCTRDGTEEVNPPGPGTSKSHQGGLRQKKNTGFRLPAPVYVGIRCFFFVGDLLDGFFSICNTKKKQKKRGLLTMKLIVPAPSSSRCRHQMKTKKKKNNQIFFSGCINTSKIDNPGSFCEI